MKDSHPWILMAIVALLNSGCSYYKFATEFPVTGNRLSQLTTPDKYIIVHTNESQVFHLTNPMVDSLQGILRGRKEPVENEHMHHLANGNLAKGSVRYQNRGAAGSPDVTREVHLYLVEPATFSDSLVNISLSSIHHLQAYEYDEQKSYMASSTVGLGIAGGILLIMGIVYLAQELDDAFDI